MKKTVIIEILLLFVFGFLLAILTMFFRSLQNNIQGLNMLESFNNPDYYGESIDLTKKTINTDIIYIVFTILSCFADIAVIVLIAIKDFPVFQPIVDKYTAWATARKADNQAKANEVAEAKKQQRIADLEKELNELKKDE